jgi:oligoendopeptidase F
LEQKSQEFGSIAAAMSVEINGEKMTIQRAAKLFEETDRAQREVAFEKISSRRLADKDQLNQLYSELISDRDEVAKNADYSNYRDYMFDALGRFDYTPKDCFDFHESIEKEVMPIINGLDLERKNLLGVSELKPWDKSVDLTGKAPLVPFSDGAELIEKSIAVFNQLDPYFGECLQTMQRLGYLDLESKEGKAPGGFNYPLYESGIPFIYMNAVGTFRDMVTMMHEGGHAIHSFLMAELELVDFQSTPSEVAELASMSMELMSMDHWDVFFGNEEDLIRAKKEQLVGVLTTLPWVATIDEFQHWIYENPTHNLEERINNWDRINAKFSSTVTDWTGWEEAKSYAWQRQLHLYEVPFYYIEYGMAQLGAVAVWRNYRNDPKKGLEQYKAALKLGYTKSIGEIYEAAGIKFDFSKEYVKELIDFVLNELKSLD